MMRTNCHRNRLLMVLVAVLATLSEDEVHTPHVQPEVTVEVARQVAARLRGLGYNE